MSSHSESIHSLHNMLPSRSGRSRWRRHAHPLYLLPLLLAPCRLFISSQSKWHDSHQSQSRRRRANSARGKLHPLSFKLSLLCRRTLLPFCLHLPLTSLSTAMASWTDGPKFFPPGTTATSTSPNRRGRLLLQHHHHQQQQLSPSPRPGPPTRKKNASPTRLRVRLDQKGDHLCFALLFPRVVLSLQTGQL